MSAANRPSTPPSTSVAETPTLLVLADADALRDHLDALNEDGETPVVVGWSAPPYTRPFLITLTGPYVESEDVLFDSPWQSDCDYGERVDGVWVPHPPRCDECQAQVHGIADLRYPVTVLAAPLSADNAQAPEEGTHA